MTTLQDKINAYEKRRATTQSGSSSMSDEEKLKKKLSDYQSRKAVGANTEKSPTQNSSSAADIVKKGFDLGFNQGSTPQKQNITQSTTTPSQLQVSTSQTTQKPTTSKKGFNEIEKQSMDNFSDYRLKQNVAQNTNVNNPKGINPLSGMSYEIPTSKDYAGLQTKVENQAIQNSMKSNETAAEKEARIKLGASIIKDIDNKYKEAENKNMLEKALDAMKGVASGVGDKAASLVSIPANMANSNSAFPNQQSAREVGQNLTQNVREELQPKPWATDWEKGGFTAGQIAGEVGQMVGLGALTGGTGNIVGNQLANSALKSAATGGINSVVNSLANDETLEQGAKDALRSALYFGVGNMGSQAAGKAIEKALIANGVQNSTFNYVMEQVAKGMAFSAAGEAATYPTYGLTGDSAPTTQEMGINMLIGMLFDTVSGVMKIPQLKAQSKATIDNATKELAKGLNFIDQVKNTEMTAKDRKVIYDAMLREINTTRSELNGTRLLGEDVRVKQYNQILDKVESDLNAYMRGEYTYSNQKAIVTNNNLLPGDTPNSIGGNKVAEIENNKPYYGDTVGKPYAQSNNVTINQVGNNFKPITENTQIATKTPKSSDVIETTPKVENVAEAKIEANKETRTLKEWVDTSEANVDLKRVERGYMHTSFDPKGRAKREVETLNNIIKEVANNVISKVEPGKEAKAIELLDNFKEGIEKRFNAMMDANSRTASTAITGPANFNHRRNNKAMEVYNNRSKEYIEYFKNAEKKILKALNKSETPQVEKTVLNDTDNVIVSTNSEKKGIEVSFKEKPTQEEIAPLKAAGFRYSAKQKIWYAKENEKTRKAVEAYNKPQEAPIEVSKDMPKEVMQAPIKTGPIESGTYGNENIAYTNDNQEIKTRYKVIDASELITSHDTNLDINKDYPQELQPRNRDRAASKLQIDSILGGLNPNRLGESSRVDDGTPIIGVDNVVESGNGRTIALTKGYLTGHKNVEEYKRWLINHGKDFGIDTSNLPKNPILVRERMTDTDRIAFTKKANESNIAQLSPSETAKSDATKLTTKSLNNLYIGDNGTNINSLENKGFINNFISECVPENERTSITTSEGLLNKQGVERVQNAIFEKVYDSRELVEMMSESTDINIKNVINTMIGISPKIAKVKENIKAGATHDLDISKSISKAASKLSHLKTTGETVEEYLQQIGMFTDLDDVEKNILAIIDSNMRSQKKLTKLFNTYYDMVEKLGDPRNESLVPIEIPSKNTLLAAAKESVKDAENITIWDIQRETSKVDSKEVQRTKGKFKQGEEQGYTSTATGPQLNRGNGMNTDVKGTKKPSEIFREFGDKLGFDISNRPQKKTLGTFNTRTSLVKIKKANDLSVLSHETGHFLDKEHGFTNTKAAYAKELLNLGVNTSPASANKEYILGEGVAEYVRNYLTNPEYAKEIAPQFTEVFEKALSKGQLKALTELQSDIGKFMNLKPQEKIKKTMSFAGEKAKKAKMTLGEMAEYTYAALFDKSHTLIYGANKMAGEAAATKMKNVLGASRGYSGKAEYAIFNAQTDAYGKDIGESLESILEPIMKEDGYKDFSAYLVAKRGMDYYEKGLEFPSTKEDCIDTINYYEQMNPWFKDQAAKIVKYNQNTLHQLVEIGMISEETFNSIVESNPNYVPCNRVMNESMTRFGGTNGNNPIKRLKGGGQDIIDPVEGIINTTYVYKKIVGDYLVKKEFFDIANSSQDIGALVIKQSPKYRASEINLETFKRDIKKAMEGAGIDEKAYNDLELNISKLLFETDTLARENEIAFKENDKVTIYKVDPLIYYAYKNSSINNQALNKAIEFMGKLNAVKRKFIITTPRYIAWNFSRDTIGNLTNTRSGITPVDIAKGLKDAMAENEIYQLAKKAGAFTSFYSNERDFSQDIIKQLNTTHNQAKTVNQYLGKAFKTTKDITDRYGFKPSEMAGRVAEFEKTLVKGYERDYGKNLKGKYIIDEVASNPKKYKSLLEEAARNARDITIDFNQSGALVKDIQLNKISLFSNAGLLGANKTVRVFADKTTRGRAIVRTAIIATMAMALHIFNSENENYEEVPDYKKDYYFNIPLGDPTTTKEFLSIPLDYGTSFFAQATPRRIYDLLAKGNDKAFKGYTEDIKQSFNLDLMLPDLLELYIELQSNKNWTGANILSYADQNKPGYLQYGEKTSGVSKAVGSALKDSPINLGPLQSPKQLDHILKSQFGTIGKMALNSIDQLTGQKEGVPIIGGLSQGFVYETYGANTQNTFYEYKKNLDKFVNEEKETGSTKYPNAKGIKSRFTKSADRISDIKKQINSGKLTESEVKAKEQQILDIMKTCIKAYEDNK